MADIPILLCFDDRILIGAGVTIASLVQAARPGTCYEINIMHPGLSADVQAGLTALVSGTPHSIRFFQIPSSRFDGLPKSKGSWTEIVYYRLLAAEVLHDRDRVIYSDVDVFFCDDMTEVFETDLEGIEWAGVKAEANGPDMVMHTYFAENTKDCIYMSGFMVMNLALMRERRVIDRYFETVKHIGDRLRFFDLDLLNVASPQIGTVPFRYAVLEDTYEADDVTRSSDFPYLGTVYGADELCEGRDDPAIIHYAGRRGKPWQRRQVPDYYNAVIKTLPAVLRPFNFRDFRKRWLSRKGRRSFPSRH
ncbi:glycosyltransferase family 8 protein [Aestuariivita boseongensis]|uniref:glycosyltransferase family 8 protein n=1 Tax=Aestuariivita boseongensis TaxID=1470562 RepID=UPI000680D436|nr:glycosyltransferase family 8 protein [Aestuariivita boseongensis]